ncbi:unnamed protein product [Boreogadus saida]
MKHLSNTGGRWNCPCLHPSVGQATHPSSIPPLNYLSWTSVTERAPCRCQDRRVAHQLRRDSKPTSSEFM